jgi:hypothetical protein
MTAGVECYQTVANPVSARRAALSPRRQRGYRHGETRRSGGDVMRGTNAMLAAVLFGGLTLGGAAAHAQAPACGDRGAEGAWIAGDPVASDLALASGALTRAAAPVPERGTSVTLFRLGTPQTVRLEARASDLVGDPVLALYDASGVMIVTDDDSGGDLSSRAETELAAGDYCLVVRGFADSALTADIRFGLLDHEALTEGLRGGFTDPGGDGTGPDFVGIQPCLPETEASALTQGPLDAALARGGAQATNTVSGTPYYRFTLDAPQGLSIRAMNETADPYIYLFDGTGALIAENDDHESLNSRIDITAPLAPGSYCIGMRALSDPDLPVTLMVLPYDAEAAAAELIATGDAAPPLDGTWPVRAMGVLPPLAVRDLTVAGTRAEWLSFEIAAPTVLLIDAVEVRDSDPLMILYDADGTEIAFNDDANGTLNSQLILRLDPGIYLLALRQYSDASQGVIRLTTERFVRAPE